MTNLDRPVPLATGSASTNLGSTPATAEQHAKIAAACARFPLSENLELYQRVTGRSIDEPPTADSRRGRRFDRRPRKARRER